MPMELHSEDREVVESKMIKSLNRISLIIFWYPFQTTYEFTEEQIEGTFHSIRPIHTVDLVESYQIC